MASEQTLFVEARLVCGDCGHELEEDEVAFQIEEVKSGQEIEGSGAALARLGLLRCENCGSDEVREVELDLVDELVRLAQVAGQAAKLIVERKPELAPRVDVMLAEARSHISSLEAFAEARRP